MAKIGRKWLNFIWGSGEEIRAEDIPYGETESIKNKVESIGQTMVEKFNLNNTDITNKYITLASAPENPGRTVLQLKDAGAQYYGVDFAMDGTNPDRLTWNGYELDGVLEQNDKLTILYDVLV